MKKAFPKIIICALLFIAVILVCLLGLISIDNARLNATKILRIGSYDNIYKVDFSDWELENNNTTFANGPSFSVIDDFLVSGDKACEYTLNCTSDVQYSITGSIYSNDVCLADNTYEISLQYYTRQRVSTPNVLTMYYLSAGAWVKIGEISCYNNGNDLNVWTEDLSLSFTGCPEKFRFDYKVYYTQPDIANHGGLYLNLNQMMLISSANTDFSSTTFSLSLESNEFVYSGSPIYPDFEISTESTEPYYYTFEAVDSGENVVNPINVGNYTLKVKIYNEANELCKTLSAPYSIAKEELALGDRTIIAGQDYAVILDMQFIGVDTKEVFSIQDLGLKRIYESGDSITVTISGNPNFKDKAFNINIPVQSIPYGLYLEDINVEAVYNGNVQDISSAVTVFTAYDSGSGTFTTTSASLDVTYTQDDVEVQSPKDVGIYDYVLTYGTSEIVGTFTIKPKELTSATYVGSANLNKVYDGSYRVSYNSIIRNKLADSDIELSGIIGTDDVTLDYESVSYAMNYGNTYLVISNPVLTGENASNYVISDSFYLTGANASISQATLEFNSVIDLNGDEMTFSEKVYDNTNTCAISNTTNACLNFIGLGAGVVTYKDVSPTLLNTNAGNQDVNLELTNASLFDIYNPSIIMTVYPKCLISKYDITLTGVTCSETDKQYDGTTDIDLIIDSISFSNPGFGDNLGNVLNYSIAYQNATFASPAVGANKTISITGITVTAFNASDQSILNNYSFSDAETTGDITAEEIIVYTEYLRIIKGAAVPEIMTSINNPDIIDKELYASELDAQNANNPVADTNTVGEYFIRVTCSSSNYTLGGLDGYVIIPLSIVNLNEKADQHITINNGIHDLTMLVGGWYNVEAGSYSEVNASDVKTGLPLSFSSKDTSIATIDADGKIMARAAGSTIITIKQLGNEYYNPAIDVTIVLNISNYQVNVDTSGLTETLYIGDSLPDLNGVASVTINSVAISGEFDSQDTVLIAGENAYKYTFTPTSGTYSGTYEVDISLTAVKKTITVLVSDTKNLTYGESLDYISSITGFRINGIDVTYSSLISYFNNSLFKVYKIDTTEDIEITGLLDVGTYVFYADKNEPGAEYYLVIDTEINGCVVELEGQIDVQVNQSVITVSISQLSKYYLEDMPTDFSKYLVLSGSYNEEDIEEILGYIDVTTGVTQGTEVGEYIATLAIKDGASVNPKYSFNFVNGYISVVPIKLSIAANSRGHVYGNEKGVIALYINITDSRLFTTEQLNYIKESITANTNTFVDVSSASNAGEYDILIEYNGDDINFDVSILESKYQVHKATLPERDFTFNDASVLYDGLSHTLEVTYDATKWPGITIVYNKTSFIEIGTYVFTAVISKENYEDLRISAELIIGVNSISNNSETIGKAEVNITSNTHILDTNYSLRIEKIEDTTNVQSLINETGINSDFIINIAYNLNVFYNLSAVELGESKYSIKLTPVGLTNTKDLLLYGYDENGKYGKIDYEYSSGTYTFVVSRLSNIAFITEVPETMSAYVIWIIVAIFGALIILVILIALSNGKRSIKSRRRSRRSHARWG